MDDQERDHREGEKPADGEPRPGDGEGGEEGGEDRDEDRGEEGEADRDEDRGEDRSANQDDDDDERPRITLDRYMSKRRERSKSGLTQAVAMILMLIMLVLVIAYKDRCGNMVSGVMGDLQTPPKNQRPAVRFEMQKPAAPPAKR